MAPNCMSTSLAYVTAVVGCLFRLFSYVFLRVIPTRLAQPILPLLYALHLFGLYFAAHFGPTDLKPGEKSSPPVRSKRPYPIWSVLLCLPSSSNRINCANLLVNTILIAAAIEFTTSPFLDKAKDVTFTRIGALYPNGAKIVVRYPFPHAQNASLNVLWREQLNESNWQQGPALSLSESSDWIATVKIENLWPSTLYEYILADTNLSVLPYPRQPIQFSTFPDPLLTSGDVFRFVVTSCATPNFPYRGPSYRRAIPGFDLLAANIIDPPPTSRRRSNLQQTVSSAEVSPEFLLFLGDFIYADVPVYIGDEKEAYRRLYRRNHQSDGFRKIYEHIPIFHTYDDHEIINNYMGEHNDSKAPYPNAADAFKLYNADANYDPLHEGQFYYEFSRGDAAFFVMDTRRYRSGVEDPDFSSRTMLGEEQLSALLNWLYKVNNTAMFKFVASSVPFTTLWSHDAQMDSWAGFPRERQTLLNAFHSTPNVIILSGDRHEFAAISFNGASSKSYPVYEFSTSPLSMFYVPFIRTLAPQSQDNVTRTRVETRVSETGPEEIEAVEQLPKEQVLKYLPIGNVKWSDIRVDTSALKPLLHLKTFIDGTLAYNLTIEGTPLRKESSTAVGFSVTDSLKDIFYKFGLVSNRWL